jgi:uncharacterized protein (TIGR03435 family)
MILGRPVLCLTAILSLGFVSHSPAQSPPAFEVATFKSSPPPAGDRININLGTLRDGMLTFTNASLSDCLKFAYGIVADAQISGPDWIKSKEVRFDVVAKAPPGTPGDQLTLMMQALLADRLKLALHHESRELPFLALVVGKNGPKVRESQTGPDAGGNSAFRGHIVGPQISMQLLATLLSRFERQIVIDMTGLKGSYEVKLEWTPDENRPIAAAAGGAQTGIDAGAGPSIFTAVQEQLGLKLESRKGPLDVVVVDHAEKVPAEN